MPAIFIQVAALSLVLLIWSMRRTKQVGPTRDIRAGDEVTRFFPVSPSERAAFILDCLRNHNAMRCYIHGEEHYLLPLSLTGDQLTAMPLGLGYREKACRKVLKLGSIREPIACELKPRDNDLALVRLALKHAARIYLRYIDESGREAESDIVPLREDNEFLICEGKAIRIQWIEEAHSQRRTSTPALRRFAPLSQISYSDRH